MAQTLGEDGGSEKAPIYHTVNQVRTGQKYRSWRTRNFQREREEGQIRVVCDSKQDFRNVGGCILQWALLPLWIGDIRKHRKCQSKHTVDRLNPQPA